MGEGFKECIVAYFLRHRGGPTWALIVVGADVYHSFVEMGKGKVARCLATTVFCGGAMRVRGQIERALKVARSVGAEVVLCRRVLRQRRVKLSFQGVPGFLRVRLLRVRLVGVIGVATTCCLIAQLVTRATGGVSEVIAIRVANQERVAKAGGVAK